MAPSGRILVVDDERQLGDMVAEYFMADGFEVVTAHDGQVALMVVDTAPPDVILLDIIMPGMSGVEVLGQLHLRWPEIPVIMLSAIDDEALAKRTLKQGAFDYVTKPFDFGHLRQCVDAALARQRPDVTPLAP